MKDALGGYFNITLLAVFILLITGFIALSISYTKAYRIKNNVLTYIEKYEGNTSNEEMLETINSYIQSVGYSASDEYMTAAKNAGYKCPKFRGQEQGWCYKKHKNTVKRDEFNIEIVVFINFDIPVVNKVFTNIKFFWMTGATNSIPILE